MRFISRIASSLARAFNTAAYLKPRTHHVRYQAMIRNLSKEVNDVLVIVPVPSDVGGQVVLSKPITQPAVERIGAEAQYGNQFAFWEMRLAPGECRMATMSCSVRVHPVRRSVSRLGTLDDYKERVSLSPSEHIESSHPDIVAAAKQIVGIERDIATILRRIADFVLGRLEYGNPIHGLYGAVEALHGVKVDCGGYSSLFVALCRAAGIPARVVSGFWAGYPKNDMHAWAEVILPDSSFLPVDLSCQYLSTRGRTRKFGELGGIGSDRIIFSVGSDFSMSVGKKEVSVDILQHPAVAAARGKDSVVVETIVHTN